MEDWLKVLVHQGEVARRETSLAPEQLQSMGFVLEGATIRLPPTIELLNAERIRRLLPDATSQWLRRLELFLSTGSTNERLAELGQQENIDGVVFAAELQTAGRGRRGRSWHSPFGQNIALSVGYDFGHGASKMGGYSLVVGLAVLDALQKFELADAQLKWPNDIQVNGAKLGGILVELLSRNGEMQAVVGVGINYRLNVEARSDIGQPVYELMEQIDVPARNDLLAALLHSIRQFSAEFKDRGFSGFREAFNAHHAYQGRSVVIRSTQQIVSGVVNGVTDEGALILDTDSGKQSFIGGEVSLRAVPTAE